MSNAENHGGIYQNLKLLRNTNGQAECNLFKAMGLDYLYVAEGNNTEKLIEALEECNLSPTVRGEALTLEQFAKLSNILNARGTK